jgi:hypothetical protein
VGPGGVALRRRAVDLPLTAMAVVVAHRFTYETPVE